MFSIAPTDDSWFEYLRKEKIYQRVNFWTPRPWNLRKIEIGSPLYFFRKVPIRLIGGGGVFVSYENLTLMDAWESYGKANGCANYSDLLGKIKKYVGPHYPGGNPDQYEIGCVELTDCRFFYKSRYIEPKDHKIEIPLNLQTIKYFHSSDPFKPSIWH